MRLVRVIKVLHTLGAVGLMGAAAAFAVLRAKGPSPLAEAHAALAPAIAALFGALAVPSMVLCLASGFASMFVHKPYRNAGWAWLKGFSGLLVLQLTFRLQSLTLALPGTEPQELPEALRTERVVLGLLLAACGLNVVVGVWRPKLHRAAPVASPPSVR